MELTELYDRLDAQRIRFRTQIPPRGAVHALADGLFQLLFPIACTEERPAAVQATVLRDDLRNLLRVVFQHKNGAADYLADAFFDQLPEVYEALLEDADAFYKFDPAAVSVEEVIATYPGFQAVATYRMANVLHRLQVPLLPRFFSEYTHGKTGIDIHPGASIGRSFFVDHGTGVVIGATAVIGDHVKIYQGVTLGALQVDKSLANSKRHPTIEDGCVIYANSTILGGKTVIGHDSVIGGNTWITESVSPHSVVLHHNQSTVRKRPFEEPINFVI
jgi:serine O-acetyltransferase